MNPLIGRLFWTGWLIACLVATVDSYRGEDWVWFVAGCVGSISLGFVVVMEWRDA